MKLIRRIFKWTGITIGGLFLLFAAAYACISSSVNDDMAHRYSYRRDAITVPSDTATIARGKHLIVTRGCAECHGKDLSGSIMANDAMIGRLTAPNLTKGPGGLPAWYAPEDWLLALRHGVTGDGRPLRLMPSNEYASLSEADLSAIISYCQQMPPVARNIPPMKIGPIAKVMTWAGKMPLLAVEKIDHNAPLIYQTDTAEGVALGRYLSSACSGCHRPDMKGGDPLAPGQPPIPDITSSGSAARWSQQQFMNALRTGHTPSGHVLNNEEMPWKMTAHYTDKEISSLYQYLQSIK